jgi:molybdopterin-guanine dinucleotide biosynthesis protein A
MALKTDRLPGEPMSSAILLAGGESKRLGRDKSLLMIEGQPLVAHTAHKLAALSDDLILVTNHPERYGPLNLPVRLVPDERPGVGALMGLYSGLNAARYPWAVVVACDMPFLSLPLLRHMLTLLGDCDLAIPRLDEMLEPLHAVYSKACLPPMARMLDQNRRRIVSFFPEVRVCYVERQVVERFDARHLSFFNVNTWQDWTRAQQMLQQKGSPASLSDQYS